MFRLGNDLVNFDAPRAKHKYLDQRFLRKVFTLAEQQIINSTPYSNIALWAIWAAKEAAYKAYKKQCEDLIFAYQKFAVTPIHTNLNLANPTTIWPELGVVTYAEIGPLIAVRWDVTPPLTHCSAVILTQNHNQLFNNWNLITHKIFKLTAKDHIEESAQTRSFAKEYLITLHSLDPNIEIKRPINLIKNIPHRAPPMVFKGEQALDYLEISLSHDHGWSAISCAKIRNSV